MEDVFELSRFVTAQDRIYPRVLDELTSGRKTTHWMWFVFPQLAGLGSSPMAIRFAIGSLAEATAYLAHDRLGPRLRECTGLVNRIPDRSVLEIFGRPDDMKFRSCMTLFSRATPDNGVFVEALTKGFDGLADPATIERLSHEPD